MLIKLNSLDKKILNRLQEGIPFVQRPWDRVARELGVKEDFLLARVAYLKKKGIIRRISAVFSPGKVSFTSTLAAVKVAPKNIIHVVKKINSYVEVTHNYRREAEYNIWFALVAKNRARIIRIISELKKDENITSIIELPAKKVFKIDVKFLV